MSQVTLEHFHAFRDERPKEEKWELIDGVPHMMPPQRLIHQRISRNIEELINTRLRLVKPEWQADREIGLLLPQNDKYNPEPDVTVIDTEIGLDQIYAERFYFVAEVLSPDDKKRVLDLKLAFYKGHEHCRAVLFVEQDRVEATLHVCGTDWSSRTLTTSTDQIAIPDIGDIGTLGHLYRHTPLCPPAFS